MPTVKAQEMLVRVSKGVSNNKLIPITSLMEIKLKNGLLSFVTTDATNYIKIQEAVDGEDFYAVVYADVFIKLISKVTAEFITFEFDEETGVFTVFGNGTYKFEVPVDENRNYITYIDPFLTTVNTSDAEIISKSVIDVILATLKPSLAVTMENPCYTNYYVGDSVIATDTFKIANLGVKLLKDPALISSELMNLLDVMTEEKITVYRYDKQIQFNTGNCIIYGLLGNDIEDYAHEAISELVEDEFESVCQIPKTKLLQVLDRLSLFVGPYDNNAVKFIFNETGLEVVSKQSRGTEFIEYVSVDHFTPFNCTVDIQMITQEVKAIEADIINLYFGRENALKMIDSNITIVIALLDENEDMLNE